MVEFQDIGQDYKPISMASMHHAKSKSISKDKAADADPSSVPDHSPSDEYMSPSEAESASQSQNNIEIGGFTSIKKMQDQ